MNAKAFFVDALTSALELGIATADDVVRHVTPEVLAECLPRPLWARLLTACVGAPRVDAQLVIETLGIPNLCEHVPAPVIWTCIAELGTRALGGEVAARVPVTGSAPTSSPRPLPVASPPPPEPRVEPVAVPAARGPSIPAPTSSTTSSTDGASELDLEGPRPSRSRTPTSQRFRPTSTGIGRLGSTARRPQAPVTLTSEPEPEPVREAEPAPVRVRRGQTEVEEVVEEPREDWRASLAVEDEQLVDWAASEETKTSDEGYGRKR